MKSDSVVNKERLQNLIWDKAEQSWIFTLFSTENYRSPAELPTGGVKYKQYAAMSAFGNVSLQLCNCLRAAMGMYRLQLAGETCLTYAENLTCYK